ncbi:unnamed protein product [Caenorhabditis angaria]|uniref:isopentenyl-diphosphate Delta-isomerase n=1 Tax=Caenorhabditis angaria TaxID=860376 RepID=A0A9P1IKJ2_9PELO|nr:unnamed protein product [Caenorhabditis angaria]
MKLSPRISSEVRRKLTHLSKYDATQVFYMKETCINVDENDRVIGSISKEQAHSSENLVLHRAFSVFSFTKNNKLLMQRRSDEKITFPNLWTNTCCSHPLHNDREINGIIGAKRAAVRKLEHELGIEHIRETDFELKGKYIYEATMENEPWGEHEMDYALLLRGIGKERCRINRNEVSEIKEVEYEELMKWINAEPHSFTPWLRMFVKTDTFSKWWDISHQSPKQEDHNIYRLN